MISPRGHDVIPTGVAANYQDLAEVVRMLLRQGVRLLSALESARRMQGMFSRGGALRIMLMPDDAFEAGAQARLDDYSGPRR